MIYHYTLCFSQRKKTEVIDDRQGCPFSLTQLQNRESHKVIWV